LLKEHIRWIQQHEKCKGTIILPDVDPMWSSAKVAQG
jgi:hypothetical protein